MSDYTIIEVANTHGGDEDYMLELIREFHSYSTGYGIKFQPLQADALAVADFEWYGVYTELYFSPGQWNNFIAVASETKDVWLDIFDTYGIQILKENLTNVFGVKLQASVLYNEEVVRSLTEIDLSEKKIILNIAAQEIEDIKAHLAHFEKHCILEEFLLEVGFQGYPTELRDSGIGKIKILKEVFGKRIVFADHIDSKDPYAIWLPAIAAAAGADIIEKHVRLEKETKYDHFSSLVPKQFEEMVKILSDTGKMMGSSFINEREELYLQKSMLKPLLKYPKAKGSLINPEKDLNFRRSDQVGLTSKELRSMQGTFHILRSDIDEVRCLKRTDFKRATIAVIIAARLKSSRLKKKALLKIGDLTSIELCIKNAMTFQNVNHTVLATSELPADEELSQYTYDDSVVFHRGDADDVIQRYLDVAEKLGIDVIIRITGDMPYVHHEICEILLESHFKTGADYTTGVSAPIGANLEIFNTSCLRKIKAHIPSADYSEYMTWYFKNNPEHFHLNLVELPDYFDRNYRLTLDYEEDLTLFNKLDKEVGDDLKSIISYMDRHPDLSKINDHLTLKYKTDKELIDLLNRKTKF